MILNMYVIKKNLRKIKLKRLMQTSLMVEEEAYKNLDTFFEGRLKSPGFFQKINNTPVVDLMIIVPVYNTEKYVRKCIESILNQKTQYSYIAVLVNDGSSDNSMKILEEYKENQYIKIISTENKGVSEARNIALIENYGKYIMFVDSDDYLEENAIENLMSIAQKYNADIVEGEYTEFGYNGNNSVKHSDIVQQVNGTELFGFAWGKVIKSSCFQNICFPSKYCYEDTIMSFLIHSRAKIIYTIPENVYYYRINPNGLNHTSLVKRNVIDTFWITKYCLEEFKKQRFIWNTDMELFCLKQFYINWLRLRNQEDVIQESVFVLTCELYNKFFSKNTIDYRQEKYKLFVKVLATKRYKAYCYLMENWNIFD